MTRLCVQSVLVYISIKAKPADRNRENNNRLHYYMYVSQRGHCQMIIIIPVQRSDVLKGRPLFYPPISYLLGQMSKHIAYVIVNRCQLDHIYG